jgi:hypothetical protein
MPKANKQVKNTKAAKTVIKPADTNPDDANESSGARIEEGEKNTASESIQAEVSGSDSVTDSTVENASNQQKQDETESANSKNEEPAPSDTSGEASTTEASEDSGETEVKTNFEKISIRALCSQSGEPFRGSYRSIRFDEAGFAEVSIEDKDSVEELIEQFPGLEIKPA